MTLVVTPDTEICTSDERPESNAQSSEHVVDHMRNDSKLVVSKAQRVSCVVARHTAAQGHTLDHGPLYAGSRSNAEQLNHMAELPNAAQQASLQGINVCLRASTCIEDFTICENM